MAVSPALRSVACVAGLNATVQGLVWAVISVLALCVCFCGLGAAPQEQANDFAQYLTYYLQGDECSSVDFRLFTGVTSPTALRLWMALSLFFSASMLASSLVLVVAVARRWSDEKLQITLVSWLFINSFTAIDDLILGYVFGNDYLTALDSTSQEHNVGPLTLGLVSFLAVRGLYLWLLNLAFIVYLFSGARALHKHLNEQVPTLDQQPIESWPTLDDFEKSKSVVDLGRTPVAVNPKLARVENGPATSFPEYSAMARWPTLNGQPATMRESRPDKERQDKRERRSKTVREYSFRRQEGVDNPGYEGDSKYYLRLQSETGSTRDYEEYPVDRGLPRSKRETSADPTTGHYKKTSDPWRERTIPSPPSPLHVENNEELWREKTIPTPPSPSHMENSVHIPPVDYLDDQPESGLSPHTASSPDRPLSLKEAILARSMRLKKVPDELKKGLQN